MQYARQQAKLAASEIQTSIVRPKKGAARAPWGRAPEGIWPLETFLQLLLGEIDRLTDDGQGYGPRGRDFVVHVDVPPEVRSAASRLRNACGEEGRPPDERYA